MVDDSKNYQGIKINNYNCSIHFLRHAQSLANIGNETIDSPLSSLGIQQSKQLTGYYDLVICSPLRRTKETLHYSNIVYDKLVINYNIREMVQNFTSSLILEQRNNFIPETETSFWKRANKFTEELQNYCRDLSKNKENSKILIISHGFFFNGWYRRGCYPTPPNGKIIKLV